MIGPFRGEHRWLSNFWPVDVELGGGTYPSVEHAYQAAKTHSQAYRNGIRLAPTPAKAKWLGRAIPVSLLREDWDLEKVSIMRDLLRQKFQNLDLATKLLETGEEKLVELNSWGDTFWGFYQVKGVGENKLGKLLMQVRQELRDEGTR